MKRQIKGAPQTKGVIISHLRSRSQVHATRSAKFSIFTLRPSRELFHFAEIWYGVLSRDIRTIQYKTYVQDQKAAGQDHALRIVSAEKSRKPETNRLTDLLKLGENYPSAERNT